jgi:hypothetical protein
VWSHPFPRIHARCPYARASLEATQCILYGAFVEGSVSECECWCECKSVQQKSQSPNTPRGMGGWGGWVEVGQDVHALAEHVCDLCDVHPLDRR